MKSWKKYVAVLGLVGALGVGFNAVDAADWYYVGESSVGDQISIDNSSVQKNSEWAVLWVRINEPSGEYYYERMRLDRENYTIQTLELQPYYSDGTPYAEDEYEYDTTVDTIVPDSVGEEVYNLVWGSR
ncbi:hypothetical protein [uncultured Veillonella sp.]|uniref:hypothetical protein n=1 Tax=uncultured Veillonella sp. TaxID=159268 RepID=UPI0025D3E62C|nr:hypothetical protein [uncultured Veillonella sp.]